MILEERNSRCVQIFLWAVILVFVFIQREVAKLTLEAHLIPRSEVRPEPVGECSLDVLQDSRGGTNPLTTTTK